MFTMRGLIFNNYNKIIYFKTILHIRYNWFVFKSNENVKLNLLKWKSVQIKIIVKNTDLVINNANVNSEMINQDEYILNLYFFNGESKTQSL